MDIAFSPALPPAIIEVIHVGTQWRMRSSDDLFSGVFADRRSALRHAQAEADCHPGHVVVLRATA